MKKIYFKFFKRAAIASFTLCFAFTACQPEEEFTPSSDELSQLSPDQNGTVIEGQYIVVLDQGAVDFSGMRTTKDYSIRSGMMRKETSKILLNNSIPLDIIGNLYSSTVQGFSAKLSEDMLAKLKNDNRVAYIEQDRIISLGPPSGKGPGGGSESPVQETPYGIDRVGGAGDGTDRNAWVIDTGIDLDHPDLIVDASRGFNAFTSGKDAKNLDDGNGHGTHVAGTIAAINNDLGVVGVAAGATVIPVKVLDSRGSGSYSGVIAGVDYVGANGASGDVANMSLGGPISQALDDAVKAASDNGIKFTLAAGNSSEDANESSPARVNGTNIYTISAMNSSDNWASFSNFGNPPVDYCAPGVSIKSTWKDGSYNTISGTSMAAPHAAGVLLLGSENSDGTVIGDPDGSPDPIIHR